MAKTIKSPVKQFPGSINLPDRLTMPQALAFERSVSDGQVLINSEETASQTEYDNIMTPVICEVVEEWNLDDLDQLSPDTFPGSPRKASHELIAWLYNEITRLYNPDVPNG